MEKNLANKTSNSVINSSHEKFNKSGLNNYVVHSYKKSYMFLSSNYDFYDSIKEIRRTIDFFKLTEIRRDKLDEISNFLISIGIIRKSDKYSSSKKRSRIRIFKGREDLSININYDRQDAFYMNRLSIKVFHPTSSFLNSFISFLNRSGIYFIESEIEISFDCYPDWDNHEGQSTLFELLCRHLYLNHSFLKPYDYVVDIMEKREEAVCGNIGSLIFPPYNLGYSVKNLEKLLADIPSYPTCYLTNIRNTRTKGSKIYIKDSFVRIELTLKQKKIKKIIKNYNKTQQRQDEIRTLVNSLEIINFSNIFCFKALTAKGYEILLERSTDWEGYERLKERRPGKNFKGLHLIAGKDYIEHGLSLMQCKYKLSKLPFKNWRYTKTLTNLNRWFFNMINDGNKFLSN